MRIYRPQEIMLMRLGLPLTMANGGGGGDSSSSQATNTTSSLTNQVSSTDSRSVASDHAIALGGAGDTVSQTSTTNNSNTNSGNSTTSFASNSGNTSAVALNSGNTNTNSGNSSFSSSSTTNITTTDFGSVRAALDAMQTTASGAIGHASDVSADAIGALTHQSDNTLDLVSNLFQFAKASSANSQGTAMQALGLANDATSQVSKTASDDKKTLTYVLIGGGVLLAIIAMKK